MLATVVRPEPLARPPAKCQLRRPWRRCRPRRDREQDDVTISELANWLSATVYRAPILSRRPRRNSRQLWHAALWADPPMPYPWFVSCYGVDPVSLARTRLRAVNGLRIQVRGDRSRPWQREFGVPCQSSDGPGGRACRRSDLTALWLNVEEFGRKRLDRIANSRGGTRTTSKTSEPLRPSRAR